MTQPQQRGMVIWRGRIQHKAFEYRVVLVPRDAGRPPKIEVEAMELDAAGGERWNELDWNGSGELIHDEVVEQAINDLVATLQQTNAAFEKVKSQLQPPVAKAKTEQEKFRDGILDSMDTD